MKTFKNTAAHGELYIRRVDALPKHISALAQAGHVAEWNDAKLVVGHSETGHHHAFVLDRRERGRDGKPKSVPPVAMIPDPNDPLTKWLIVHRPVVLRHLRDHHQHEALRFGKGFYEVRDQREWSLPGAWSRVAD